MMWQIIKAVLVLVILAVAGLVIYAHVVDFTPAQNEVTKPVVLDAN